MSEAICFNCKKVLGIGISMEKLLEGGVPVFCGNLDCSSEFPQNGTKEFEDRFKELKGREHNE